MITQFDEIRQLKDDIQKKGFDLQRCIQRHGNPLPVLKTRVFYYDPPHPQSGSWHQVRNALVNLVSECVREVCWSRHPLPKGRGNLCFVAVRLP